MKIIKIITIAIILISMSGFLILFSIHSYNKYQRNKESELRQVEVFSLELERRRKFLDIVLEEDINNYEGFKLIKQTLEYDKESGEEVWAYFGKENKYTKIGDFHILDPILDAEIHGIDIPRKEAEGASKSVLYLHTFNKKIYKIKVTIKEYGDNFNEVLKKAYGPAVNDNGYNDVDYLSNNNIVTWKSKNVLLTSRLETKLNRIRNEDATTIFSSVIDNYRYLEYTYKPLQLQSENQQKNKESQKTQSASENL